MKHTADIVRHRQELEALYINAGLGESRVRFFTQLDRQLHACADPAMTLLHLVRFLDASFGRTTLLHDLTEYPVLLETAITLFDTSRFFSEILIRDPELFRWLTATDTLSHSRTPEEMNRLAAESTNIFRAPEKKINALKRFQRRELLRIGARDLLAHAELAPTTAELSKLADALIATSASIAWQQTAEQFAAVPEASWAIYGLGKLGGNELNYSSDIDLLAVYESDGPLPHSGQSNSEFFARWYEATVQILSATTEEGYLYRVDTRLRPDGGSGPIIRSFDATMLYYESRGELWERQMLIKARRVAGNEHLGSRLLDRLRPFVYPRSLFANPLNEIARIKARIEAQSGDAHNIKLCSGGIRDIEFIVQALQLMNGGRSPELRTGTTTDAIERLETRGLLSTQEAFTLRSAYGFYRTIEHRLQMLDYAQTHSIPADPAERTKLALRLEMRLPAFDRSLKHSLSDVRRIFDAVFAVETLTAPSDVERLLLEQPDSEFARKFCLTFRFEDPASAVKRLRRMFSGSGLPGMKEYTEHTRSCFRAIAPQLLAEIGKTVLPDQTLARCEQIFSSFPAIDSLYTSLSNPSLCAAMTTLCGKSPWLTRIFMNNRSLIDYVITRLPEIASGFEIPFPKTVTHRSLVEWKLHSEVSAVARYLLGIIDEQTMFARVSDAAERILTALFAQQRRRLRIPSTASMCVIALGKLGGREISPGSDLDVIFIFRGKTKADAARCERLAAALMEQASAVTPEGSLYDIDARLRPEGRNAPLATSLKAYKEYFQHRASLWERQSLTRVRIIAGDAKLAGDIEAFLHDSVYGASLPPHWRAAILAMRKKTEARSRTRTMDYFDVKLSAGGLMDVEFAVQSLQLAAGLEAVASTNSYELLKEYGRRMPMIHPLIENYKVLRRLETALRLGLDQPSSIVPVEKNAQRALASWMNIQNTEDLTAYMRSIAKQNRSILELLLTQDP